MTRAVTGALSSNAGDQYHFVYAARRMLDMLHPRRDLSLIVMEGVSSGDIGLGDGPETFLGVDLTEYYGGEDHQTAERVVITQVKYSVSHPTRNWTLNRLCANERAGGTAKRGTSLIRKLARVYDRYCKELGPEGVGKATVQLHTNQQLAPTLRRDILVIRRLVAGEGPRRASATLRACDGHLGKLLATLQGVTKLSWLRLALFIQNWNLDGFGQASLTQQHGKLFQQLATYKAADADVYSDRLCFYAQDCATPHGQHEIREDDVYAQLQIRREDFFPAPYSPEPIPHLQPTRAVADLEALVELTGQGIIVLHGFAGTGKSVTLRQFADTFCGGQAVVLYDCWAGGAGRQPGSERYPLAKFFTQVTNELESLYHTGIFAHRRDDYDTLMHRFNLGLEVAAEAAAVKGHRLVIAVDSVESAVEARRCAPIQQASFVPVLWTLALPQNCVITVSSKTDHLRGLGIPDSHSVLEVEGFEPEEAAAYLLAHIPGADNALVDFAYRQTHGNPRILHKVLEQGMRQETDDWKALIVQIARPSLQEYYRDACKAGFDDIAEASIFLALLLELVPPRRLSILAEVLGWKEESTSKVLDSLHFGLRSTKDDEIEFADQDFFEFAGELAQDARQEARQALASYCEREYANSAYAQSYLAHHYYQAGRRPELIAWLGSEHLRTRIETLSPNEEDAFPEIQYGLKAAVDLGQFADALKLLAHAAVIAQGRDVFGEEAAQFVETAVQFGYYMRMLQRLERSQSEEQLASHQFQIAAELARLGIEQELAEDLIRRGIAAVRHSSARVPEGQRGQFSADDVRQIALYECFTKGAAIALRRLQNWKPQDSVYSIYADVAGEWVQLHGGTAANDIEQAQLEQPQHVHALAGMLCAGSVLQPSDARQALLTVVEFLESSQSAPRSLTSLVPDIVESSLRLGLSPDLVKVLLRFSVPQVPTSPLRTWQTSAAILYPFLRQRAMLHALGLDSFDPNTYEMPDLVARREVDSHRREEQARDLKLLRDQLAKHFPAALAHVRALLGASDSVVVKEIVQALKPWIRAAGDPWYKPNRQYVDFACECLRAIVALKRLHLEVARKVCQATERVLPGVFDKGLASMAGVLSSDDRYHGLAESLIHQRIEETRQPNVAATMRVQALLGLCPILARIDEVQAGGAFEQARAEAAKWDSRADSRLLALVRTASSAQAEVGLATEQAERLVAVFDHIGQINWEQQPLPTYATALRVVSRNHPALALQAVSVAEDKQHIALEQGIVAIGHGLLDSGQARAAAVWPLAHFMNPDVDTCCLLRQVADRLVQGGNESALDGALGEWALCVRRSVSQGLRLQRATELLEWAELHDLAKHSAVKLMSEYASQLAAIGVVGVSRGHESGYYPSQPSDVAQSLQEVADRDPLMAFNQLQALTDAQMQSLSFPEFQRIAVTILPPLTVRQTSKLASITAMRNWRYESGQALAFLTELAKRTRPVHDASAQTVRAIQQLVDASFLTLAQHTAREERGLYDLVASEHVEPGDRFRIVLSAVIACLPQLRSDELYWLIGRIVEQLPGADAADVFTVLLDHASRGVPPSSAACVHDCHEDSEKLLVQFICRLLGDPRQRVCWQAAYALIDLAMSLPELTLPLLFAQAGSESHPRWMTVREWAMFVVRHLSLRCPGELVQYVDEIAFHALNPEFPHATIREHGKHSLLAVERALPHTLDSTELEAVRRVNEPIACLVPDLVPRRGIPYDGDWWRNRQGDGQPFRFDSMDTLPYWFAPVARQFGLHRCHVCDAAKRWVVDKWQITTNEAERDYRSFASRYDWRELSHRHGHYPSVMTLARYVEYHSMNLVGGEFIDSRPAFTCAESWSRPWEDWALYHLNPADPALTSRLLDGPPAQPDHFGLFEQDFDVWAAKDREDDFKKELLAQTKPGNWLVLSAESKGSFQVQGRCFSTSVDSALVQPETACAFARAIESEGPGRPVVFPFRKLQHDILLPTLDEHAVDEELTDWSLDNSGSQMPSDDAFVLEPSCIHWHTERLLHCHDPKWPSLGRTFALPGPDFVKRMQLTREPLTLRYLDPSGQVAALCEVWDDHAGSDRERADYVAGHRLVVHRRLLRQYLAERNSWLILTVCISRQRPYRSTGFSQGEYDPGTVRAYVFTDEGDLMGC